MLAVLLTIHIIACVVLVVAVMLQRSEGGALGMGGGGTGGLISGRGAAGVLVKVTAGLAALFFATSVLMTRINNEAANAPSVLEQQSQQPADPFKPAPVTTTTPSTTAPAPATTTAPSTTTTPAAPAPAPAIDPLAPKANTPATTATTPATKPPASTPAPATTTPTTPAPAPQNGGSNN
ncbi:MAG: preprotein translocase subunit SecG [Hyphomonadaceae bacterium]